MDASTYKERTRKSALRVIRLLEAMQKGPVPSVIGKQFLWSGISIGANYRPACPGRGAADVFAEHGIVEEEADETPYGLDFLVETRVLPMSRLETLTMETYEIPAMTVATIKTHRRRRPASTSFQSKIQNSKLTRRSDR